MDIISLVTVVSAVVTGASVVVKGAQMLAKLTPTKKDDSVLLQLANGIGFVGGVLHILSMNSKPVASGGGSDLGSGLGSGSGGGKS